jgi:hypothetical protein
VSDQQTTESQNIEAVAPPSAEPTLEATAEAPKESPKDAKEKEVVDPLSLIVPSLPRQVTTQEELLEIADRHALWLESVLSPRAPIGHGRGNFAGTDIKHLNFSGLNFSGASFKSCDAVGVDFSAAVLNGCDFCDADLENANFTNAKLKHVKFHRAHLLGTNFDLADTHKAEFQLARGMNKGGAEAAPAEGTPDVATGELFPDKAPENPAAAT